MEYSFWYTKGVASYPRLESDITTDVLIIGGGLAGATCAYELVTRGFEVVLIEAAKIGSGETGRSSAIVTFAHDLLYDRLIKKHGYDVAAKYLQLNKNGAERLKQIIRDEKIECGYKIRDMVLFSTTRKGKKQIIKEHAAYDELGQDTELSCCNYELPFPVTASLTLKDQACLDPYKFLHALVAAIKQKGGKVFEDSPALVEPKHADNGQISLKVNGHTILANNIIIATHYPYINLSGLYFIKMYQHRSHNVVFDESGGGGTQTYDTQMQNIYESAENKGFEYRPVDGGVMCGGANVRTGKYKHKSGYKTVENNIHQNFGGARIVSRFAAQDCMTFDLLPFAGRHNGFAPFDDEETMDREPRVRNGCGGKADKDEQNENKDKNESGVYVVSGFNKWGFSVAPACAALIADQIEGKHTRNIFDTRRAYLPAAPLQFLANFGVIAGEFANLLINADAKKIKRIQKGMGAVVRWKGKRIGVYRDGAGRLHAISAYCPHMRCGLKWNKDELSWDCPCHGSRFDVNGNLLNNPALENAERVDISGR
ncbi:MAG: FAD-dependent oxidoreductase [Firmicutes bacterium]|nr:FAD-dependent oxidoreductase [Bacillota bacterium]